MNSEYDKIRLRFHERIIADIASVKVIHPISLECIRLPLGSKPNEGILTWIFVDPAQVRRCHMQVMLCDILRAVIAHNALEGFEVFDVNVATPIEGSLGPDKHLMLSVHKPFIAEAITAIENNLECEEKEKYVCYVYHPLL